MKNQRRIALENNKLLDKLKIESLYLLGLLVTFIIIFKIVFYQEKLLIIVWSVLSFFLTFTLPGFILCYIWHEKLDFTERFIIGNMIGIISVGILAYNFSVYTGIHIKYLSIISPVIVTIIFGAIVYFLERRSKKQK